MRLSNYLPYYAIGLGLVVFVYGCVQNSAIQTDFAAIKGGSYVLGAKNHLLNPLHKVTIAPFEISVFEITNRQFEAFVEATAYITVAEKHHDAMVFYPGLEDFRWHRDSTAYWRFPNGKARGGILEKMDHPVTCISVLDVRAYCAWAGVRLPTLDEWEVATRAGKRSHYFWGNDKTKMREFANIWHGTDHLKADTADAFPFTAPVGSFPANPNGLFDIYGNVFEFCGDLPKQLAGKENLACARGGSWWCSFASCSYFNSVDIGRVNVMASFSNQGFRVAR